MRSYSITYEDMYASLKKLAKTIYWQTIYSHFKEGSLNIFENKCNYTSIQLEFLQLLSYYYNVITDVSAGIVGEKVLENDIFIDAYSYYRNKKFRDEQKKAATENLHNKMNNSLSKNQETWKFTVPKKKKDK